MPRGSQRRDDERAGRRDNATGTGFRDGSAASSGRDAGSTDRYGPREFGGDARGDQFPSARGGRSAGAERSRPAAAARSAGPRRGTGAGPRNGGTSAGPRSGGTNARPPRGTGAGPRSGGTSAGSRGGSSSAGPRRGTTAGPRRPGDAYPSRRAPAGDGRSPARSADLDLRVDIPDSITADQLDPESAAELRTLPGDLATVIARLLVATAASDDPDEAYRYAKKARGLAARVGVVRETCAIAAYQAGDWAGALTEFRAARRLTGRHSYLPLMADCERALGRLDRALDLVTGPEARAADPPTRIELRIVESGIRRDQGLLEAAVVALQGPELRGGRIRPEHTRLYYAYADALLAAGRPEDARDWFGRAASSDVDGDTDADERFEELDDVGFDDLGDDADLVAGEPLDHEGMAATDYSPESR